MSFDFEIVCPECGKAYDCSEAACPKCNLYPKDASKLDVSLEIGAILEMCEGVKQDSIRLAAYQGDADAQNTLGGMCRLGELGVEQDFKEAFKWYQKAADQGDAEAQHNLGLMYGRADGVRRDLNEAIKWFQKAADQGHAAAQNNLGVLLTEVWRYYESEEWEQAKVTAYAWLDIAAANGEQQAKSIKSKYAKEITPSQIVEAEELVKEMIKKNPKLLN